MMYLVVRDNETDAIISEANADIAPAPGDVLRLGDQTYLVIHREFNMNQHAAAFTNEQRFTAIVTVYVEPHEAG